MRGNTTFVGVDRRARLMGKSLTIGVLVLLLSALYLLLIGLLAPRFNIRDLPVSHMLATVLIAILVVPLRNRLGIVVNRMLRREWQSSQDLLREFGMALSRTIDPIGLHRILTGDLARRLRLQSATIWMLEPPHDRVFVTLGPARDDAGAALLADGATARQLAATPAYLMVPDLPGADLAPFIARQVRLLIPLRVGDRLIGIYGCGAPQSGGLYPERTIDVLLRLAPAAASALENARAYSTIARLNQELRALDQLKDEFIQSVGHELRTPLTSLSLAVQLLGRQPDMPPPLAQVTRTSVAQLQALVDRVLEFDLDLSSPAEAQHLSAVPVELAPLLEEIVSWYTPIAEAKGVHFQMRVPSGLVAWGQIASLRRALHEVVDNAVRYGEGGTVTLAAALNDGLAVVSISDQGPGIPQGERDRVFATFYRGISTRALSATPGAGLGLSIARRDIEALGGRIWLEDSGPSGSTICVALRAAPAIRAPETFVQERAVGA
ncbi:MAG TPA: HAMP domain-containing sensor histidine kinase [Roseiflexaceae bacterium]|nr:HAMP domain-containing sensor histidine kinase [Roseiflexaceae bacterium]